MRREGNADTNTPPQKILDPSNPETITQLIVPYSDRAFFQKGAFKNVHDTNAHVSEMDLAINKAINLGLNFIMPWS